MDNVISSAKTDMFRIRMNPEIREELEQIYAKTGLTLTDAINVFFQQSLNAGGFPFAVTGDNAEIVKAKALARLQFLFFSIPIRAQSHKVTTSKSYNFPLCSPVRYRLRRNAQKYGNV